MQKKRLGFVLALLLSAVLFLPNTALADNPEAKGTFFVDDVVEQVMEEEQTEQEKFDVVEEATETEEKEAVLTKEDVAGKTLTILHTNDVHGHVENSSKDGKKGNIGYANYAGIIEAKKAEGPTLVVDGGDLTQGTNFVTLSKGESIINLANKIGAQAMVPGNHEFDYSQEQAKKNASLANFPWFASNVFDKDGNLLFHGGEVLDVQGIKVGVFGLATPETKYKANPLNTEGLTFTDTVDETVRIAQREIDKLLSRGANYTVLLSHLGSDEESEVNTLKVVPKLKNLDLVVDGHSHTEWQNGHVFENGTVGASTGEYLKNVGIVQVTFDEEGKAETKAELINYEQAKTYPVNKAGKKTDKSVLIYNNHIKIINIPKEAHNYIVNGKSAIEWLIDRYQITPNKDSGIVNDPNLYSDNPGYIIDLILKVIEVSVRSVKLINKLPKIDEIG